MTDHVSAAAKPQLFYSDGSPYARICRMAMREGGLADQVQEVLTTLRDPKAAVLPFSPAGRVPALVLPDRTAITETSLIVRWLDSYGAQPAMFPVQTPDIAAYGRVLGMLDGIAVWNRELRRPVNERSPSVIDLENLRANRIADVLENDVAAGAYTKVDAGYLALASVLGYCERRHTVWKWREGRPGLSRWFDQASQRTAFQETLPPVSGI